MFGGTHGRWYERRDRRLEEVVIVHFFICGRLIFFDVDAMVRINFAMVRVTPGTGKPSRTMSELM
jgi:hypothetical protein